MARRIQPDAFATIVRAGIARDGVVARVIIQTDAMAGVVGTGIA